MKYLGVVRNIDSLGRLVIPSSFRHRFDLEPYEAVEVIPQEGGIFVKRFSAACALCDSDKKLVKFGARMVCLKCVKEIKGL